MRRFDCAERQSLRDHDILGAGATAASVAAKATVVAMVVTGRMAGKVVVTEAKAKKVAALYC